MIRFRPLLDHFASSLPCEALFRGAKGDNVVFSRRIALPGDCHSRLIQILLSCSAFRRPLPCPAGERTMFNRQKVCKQASRRYLMLANAFWILAIASVLQNLPSSANATSSFVTYSDRLLVSRTPSPDGSIIAFGVSSFDPEMPGAVFVGRTESEKQPIEIALSEGTPFDLAISMDNKFVAVVTSAKHLQCWQLSPVKLLADCEIDKDIRTGPIQFTADGSRVWMATGTTIQIFDLSKQAIVDSFFCEHMPLIDNIDISPDGKLLAVPGFYRCVQIFDTQSHQLVRVLCLPKSSNYEMFYNCNFSGDGKRLFARSSTSQVFVWNMDKPDDKPVALENTAACATAYSPDGKVVAVLQDAEDESGGWARNNRTKAVDLRDSDTGALIRTIPFKATIDSSYFFRYSADGSRLLIGGCNAKVQSVELKR